MINKDERTLVIVESPNKVKSLKGIFKDVGYNKVIVMASVGHITEIKDGGTYWNTGIYPGKSFKADYVVSSDKKDVVEKLKEQVSVADKVFICSDPDREGESIAWSLKKFLKIPEDKYERVTFHEITPKAVLNAFKSPRKIDEELVLASQARQKLDKMVGYRLSPISRTEINAKSVGRCQSAGLKLIVQREEEIQNFIPEKYAELILSFTKDSCDFKAKYIGIVGEEMKRPSYEYCNQVIDECIENSKKGIWFKVQNIETKEKFNNPKPPFTTSTFQQEVSSKLGISVKTSMSYAQKLFEGLEVNGKHVGLITYIRTDSADFAPEFLPVLESYVKDNYGEEYFAKVKKAKKNENSQDGHECLRVTDLEMTPEKLSKYITDDKLLKVYTIIYKRTLQCAFKPSIVSETTYTIENGKHQFNLVSRELLFDGYKKVYGNFEDKDDDIIKVTLDLGEEINKSYNPSLVAEQKETTPPARYKEATFIKELEKQGIGRPSTFATIVETVLSESRGYCTIVDKNIVPTDLGIKLSHFLDDKFGDIININYTAEMEKDLDLIATGELYDVDFLHDFYINLENSASKASTTSTDKVCPECGKPLVVRNGKYGKFLGCSGYPKCKHIERI